MAEQLEQKYYNQVFTRTDISGSSRIDGKQAVTLFKTSGVAVQLLKQIWDLATPNKEDFLDKNRFFVALKLIALAQEGKPVSIQLLHEKTALPRFEGIELPQVTDEWDVGETELGVYINGFKKLSGDKGFLTINESKELLQRTQFTPQVLLKIWGLIELDSTGNMGQDQFVVAMQLISKVRAGVEVPDALPGSLARILKKNKPEVKPEIKDEVKKPEVRLKDPEPHIEVPKPVSGTTLEMGYEESPRLSISARVPQIDMEKHFKEKERLLKDKTNMLKSICEVLEFDEAELDLTKEKNKILEEKIKESEANYEKLVKKIDKAKDSLVKELTQSQKLVESLKKENAELQQKASVAKQPVISVAEVKAPEALPKKNVNFEFDTFFKEPAAAKFSAGQLNPADSSLPREPQRVSLGFEAQKLAPAEPKSILKAPIPDPRPESEKPKPTSMPEFNPGFNFSNPLPTKPQVEEKLELKKPVSSEFMPMGFEMKAPSRSNDFFADLDQPAEKPKVVDPLPPKKENEAGRPSDFGFKFEEDLGKKIEKPNPFPAKRDSEVPKSSEFGFKFDEDLGNKIEKPPAFDFKTAPMNFNAQFGDFNKGFMFNPATSQSFDSEFFKADAQAVQSKGKARNIEFD